jgi:hypothetical protein
MSERPITLADEIADLRRELAMRKSVYLSKLNGITDPRKIAEITARNEHQLACTRATLARLEALIPQQGSLF